MGIHLILGKEWSSSKTVTLTEGRRSEEIGLGDRQRQASWDVSLEPLPFFPVPYHNPLGDPVPIPKVKVGYHRNF